MGMDIPPFLIYFSQHSCRSGGYAPALSDLSLLDAFISLGHYLLSNELAVFISVPHVMVESVVFSLLQTYPQSAII